MTESSPPKQPEPIRARRWAGPASPPARPRPYRMAMRLIGIPAAAVAGVLIYRGVRDRFVLPECDLARAKHSLSDVLKELQLEPTKYEPIKTISTSKDEVVCNAVLPLMRGGSVVADYIFYWNGNTADMKYSISRKPS